MDLSIIIVNWNSAGYVQDCIRSIRAQTSSMTYEVIVVDNGSFDDCSEKLTREHPGVLFVQSPHNLGFARANNLGAWHAGGKVFLFLNPDTEVEDRAIDRLYGKLRQLPDGGVIGCRLLNSDGSLQASCVQAFPTVLNQVLDGEMLRRWFPRARLWGTAALLEDGSAPAEVEAVSGACTMIKRQVFDLIGGFSQEYFMYGEDLDLCFKARCAGFRNYYLGEATVVHHGGGSTGQGLSDFSNVMMRDSVRRFLRKSHSGFYSHGYRMALSGAAVIRLLLLGGIFPVWSAKSRLNEWRASFRKWWGILRWGLGLERPSRQYGRLIRNQAG